MGCVLAPVVSGHGCPSSGVGVASAQEFGEDGRGHFGCELEHGCFACRCGLDAALDELQSLRKGVMAPDATAEAGRAIGLLYVR